ncbi:MAG: Lead, cadmium, zinc and mercury transporting ATPase [Myxococcaceae bacterium]|nr:Lead, cadmium, zinc and mercury transporting ATPase [Myxococcaceae bacterium]
MSNPLRNTLIVLSLCCASLAAGCSPSPEKPALTNELAMTVTDSGFEPQNLRVRAGQPVVLTITRKSDSTCATEIVIDEYAVNTKLPLNEPVAVRFTPKKSGALKYGCAMQKMIGGVITVE